MWVQGLEWPDLPCFNNATRTQFSVPTKPVAGFVKSCKKLSFYWILDAGHMVGIQLFLLQGCWSHGRNSTVFITIMREILMEV